MNPSGTCELRDPHHGLLDVPGGDHHEVGKLIDHHKQVGIRRQNPFGALRKLYLACPHRFVEVIDMPEPEGSQVVVAHVHLTDHPGQSLGSLLGIRDDGGHQVRYPLVVVELHSFGVHQKHPHLLWAGPHHDGGDQGVDET